MEQVVLSNGEKIEIKPLTLRQAKACGLSKIIKKIASSVGEDGNLTITDFDFTEDEIIAVVEQVYPDWEKLTYIDSLEIFSQTIASAFKKK